MAKISSGTVTTGQAKTPPQPDYQLIYVSLRSLCGVALMAPPHTMSPPKNPRPRPGPLTKPTNSRSLVQARLSIKSYSPPSQPAMSTMPEEENRTIEQFRLHGEKNADNLPAHLPEDHTTRRSISYTKEQKLAAISYATNTWKAKPDGFMELITKYRAAANLGITTAILRDWIRSQPTIESMHQGGRKNRVTFPCQEPILEKRLVELFTEARKVGRKIYGHLYPERIAKSVLSWLVSRFQDTQSN